MAVYFFYGQEEYDISNEIKKIKDKYLDETFASMNLRYFDAPEFKELMTILYTSGTMFGNIVNIINCNKYIFDKTGTLSEEQLSEIEKNLEASSDNVHNIFVLTIPRNIDYKVLKSIPSKKLCKILIKKTVSKECKEYRNYDKELFNRIIQIAKEKNLLISTDTAKFIVEKIGVNLKLINSQLEKLQLSIYPENKVTKENIKEYLTLTEDVFKIADYLLEQKKDMALWEFRKNCDNGRHYLEILALLQKKFTDFISIKSDIETMPLAEAAAKNEMGEYPAKLLLQKMSGLSLSNLVNIKKNLIKAEDAIKTDYSLSGELEIEKAILSDI